jgi:glutamate-1-semialdehyde aminotransferase
MKAIPVSAGSLPEHAQNTLIAPFNDEGLTEAIVKKHGSDLDGVTGRLAGGGGAYGGRPSE